MWNFCLIDKVIELKTIEKVVIVFIKNVKLLFDR